MPNGYQQLPPALQQAKTWLEDHGGEVAYWASYWNGITAAKIVEAAAAAAAATDLWYGGNVDGERSNAFLHCVWSCLMVQGLSHDLPYSQMEAYVIATHVGDVHEGEAAFEAIEAAEAGAEVSEDAVMSYMDLMNNQVGRNCGLAVKHAWHCYDCCQTSPYFVRRKRGVYRGQGKDPLEPAWPPATTPNDGEAKPGGTTSPGTGPNAPREEGTAEEKEPQRIEEDREHTLLPSSDSPSGVIHGLPSGGSGRRPQRGQGLGPFRPYPPFDPLPEPFVDPCTANPTWCPGAMSGGGGGGMSPQWPPTGDWWWDPHGLFDDAKLR